MRFYMILFIISRGVSINEVTNRWLSDQVSIPFRSEKSSLDHHVQTIFWIFQISDPANVWEYFSRGKAVVVWSVFSFATFRVCTALSFSKDKFVLLHELIDFFKDK